MSWPVAGGWGLEHRSDEPKPNVFKSMEDVTCVPANRHPLVFCHRSAASDEDWDHMSRNWREQGTGDTTLQMRVVQSVNEVEGGGSGGDSTAGSLSHVGY